jgi:hypothetical protein
MKERPIIFNSEMVRALLDGRKTMTRRVIVVDRVFSVLRPFYDGCFDDRGNFHYRVRQNMDGIIGLCSPGIAEQWCPYGQPGDRLWVREAFKEISHRPYGSPCDEIRTFYRADYPPGTIGPWKPGIHMFRKCSRILLEITNVRVERVQDVTESDAIAEGCEEREWAGAVISPSDAYRYLWNDINEKRGFGWDVNPWVWVVQFRVVEPS